MKAFFWACAGLSIGLHGALAMVWQPRPVPVALASAGQPAARLQTRLVTRPQALPLLAPTPTPALALAEPAHAPPATPTTKAADPVAATRPPATRADGADDSDGNGDAIGPIDTAAQESSADADATTAAAGWDRYLPRAQLTVTPRPREDIVLAYPAEGPAVGRFVLTLTLYIDEAGWVRRVDVASDEALPDPLHQAAQASFAGRRFTPGELEGAAVKSRIRIEVLFESLALPRFAANTSDLPPAR